MIVFHGSTKKLEHFQIKPASQISIQEFDTLGIWCTSNFKSAQSFAIGTETVCEKSETEFWEDGTPKVVQYDKAICGFIYKVYIDEPSIKEYESYELFMDERDPYCDYASAKKGPLTWKDKAILLNKDEANADFRKNIMKQGFDGILIREMVIETGQEDMYCIFSGDIMQIADVLPLK
ncbi:MULTISPECIES: hypothetical protein [Cytobacillus]|uniref:hypothetical protein n=1 Tax=Cytobacillus TaxID=2675230 RepID=UPI00203C94BC|nr:hypothetical protein [Cytobacillus firmus]MCM3708404.1 hypothetical protein [Cytobacillus firmus]